MPLLGHIVIALVTAVYPELPTYSYTFCYSHVAAKIATFGLF